MTRFCLFGVGILAVIAIAGCQEVANKPTGSPAPGAEKMVEVVSAAKDLAEGDKLSEGNMVKTKIAERLIPVGIDDDVARASDWLSLMGLEVATEVKEGRIIRLGYLRGGTGNPFPGMIPKVGFERVHIGVNRESCPPNLAHGMFVDLVVTVPGKGGKLEAISVMEYVLVGEVDGETSKSTVVRNPESVGLEIRRPDARKLLAYLQTKPPIKLVIRNPDEKPLLKGFNPELESFLAAPPVPK